MLGLKTCREHETPSSPLQISNPLSDDGGSFRLWREQEEEEDEDEEEDLRSCSSIWRSGEEYFVSLC